MTTWFESWFDSKYYHMLYANRDEQEAETFIASLIDNLQLKKDAYVMDLGCGKGRHSVSLNNHGYKVLGVDLASNSIDFAKQYESDSLHFMVGDMRNDLGKDEFDAVFNLFTSFGYFDGLDDNLMVLRRINTSLKTGGILVIDFMNAPFIERHLVESEEKIINDVGFNISRHCDGNHFHKKIDIHDIAHQESHTERVQYIDQSQFMAMLSKAGFEIINEYGNYQLGDFELDNSPRLILHARKK